MIQPSRMMLPSNGDKTSDFDDRNDFIDIQIGSELDASLRDDQPRTRVRGPVHDGAISCPTG